MYVDGALVPQYSLTLEWLIAFAKGPKVMFTVALQQAAIHSGARKRMGPGRKMREILENNDVIYPYIASEHTSHPKWNHDLNYCLF